MTKPDSTYIIIAVLFAAMPLLYGCSIRGDAASKLDKCLTPAPKRYLLFLVRIFQPIFQPILKNYHFSPYFFIF